jgi:hypothetical protein
MGVEMAKRQEGANHPRLGKTKDVDEGTRRTSEKLKTASSFFDPRVKQQCIDSRKAIFRANPSRHPNSSVKPTKREALMLDRLRSQGWGCDFSFYVPHYWIDIKIDGMPLGIECFRQGRKIDWTRHQEICSQGIFLIYVGNNFIDGGDLSNLYEYISNFQVSSFDPSSQCQETVILGSSESAHCQRQYR